MADADDTLVAADADANVIEELDVIDGTPQDEVTEVDDEEVVETEEETDVEEGSAEEEPAPEEPPIEALQHWPYQVRELFNELNGHPKGREIQQTWIDTYKDFQRREMEHVRHIERQTQTLNEIDELMRPYDQEFARAGMDRIAGVRRLLSWGETVARNPAQGIAALASAYGLDLLDVAEGQPYMDPQQHATNQQIMGLQNELATNRMQHQQHREQEFHRRLMDNVRAFREATDEAGKPKYPHADTVAQLMVTMAQADMDQLQMPDLEALYHHAVDNHPQTKEMVINERVQAELDRRAKAAKKAKKASATVKGSASPGAPKAPARTLHEETVAAANAVWAKHGYDDD